MVEVKEEIKNIIAETYNLEFLKNELNHKKDLFEKYCRALVMYNMEDTAYSALMARELYVEDLNKLMKECAKTGKGFMTLMFGKLDKNKTEEDRIKEDIKYYDELINIARNRFTGLSQDIKMKIARDSIIYFNKFIKLPNVKQLIDEEKKEEVRHGMD